MILNIVGNKIIKIPAVDGCSGYILIKSLISVLYIEVPEGLTVLNPKIKSQHVLFKPSEVNLWLKNSLKSYGTTD